jgi:lysophospholipase L1-like esterase
MFKQILYVYLIAIHLLLAAMLYKSNFIDLVKQRFGIWKVEKTEYYFSMTHLHARMDANLPKNTVLFIGDSIVQGLAVSAIATPSVNYGIGTDTTTGVLQRMLTYSSLRKANAVVLHIGWNDFKYREDSEIIENIKKIISRVPIELPVVLSAILITNTAYRPSYKNLNKRAKNINKELEKWAATQARIFFVDSNPFLSNTKGEIKTDFHIGDGLHLNTQGNTLFIEVVKKGLVKARKWQQN